MWLIFALLFSLPVIQEPSRVPAVTAPSQPASSKVWVGRYAEFEAFLASAKIERFENVSTGVTRPRHALFTPGGLAGGAIVKNLPPARREGYWESYKSEIAAYRLDRVLQLDMVPPTIERRVEGDLMSAQLWVENTRTLKKVQELKLAAPDSEAWNRQTYRQTVFDDLIGNIDENAGNLLFDPVWNFIKVDCSRCFTDTMKRPFELKRIDRPFYERVKALDEAVLNRELGPWLERGTMGALLARQKAIITAFEKLAREKGEAQVFLP